MRKYTLLPHYRQETQHETKKTSFPIFLGNFQEIFEVVKFSSYCSWNYWRWGIKSTVTVNVNPFKHPIVVSSTNRRWSTFNALNEKPTATSEYFGRFFFFSLLVSYSWNSKLVRFSFSILRVSICHFLRDSILFTLYRFRIVFVIPIRVAVEIGE